MEILLVVIPILALVGYLIGKSKGRASDGAVLGGLLGPIGWLVIAASKSEGMRKCPFCAEEVKSEATVCRFCSSELPVLPALPSKPSKPPLSAAKQALIVFTIVTVGIGAMIVAMVAGDGKSNVGKPNKDGLYVDAQGHWHGLTEVKRDTTAPEIRRARPNR